MSIDEMTKLSIYFWFVIDVFLGIVLCSIVGVVCFSWIKMIIKDSK